MTIQRGAWAGVAVLAFMSFRAAAFAQQWTETVYDLPGGTSGANVWGTLAGTDALLYGTTQAGGTYNYGTVFSFQPPTFPGGNPTETVLYSFAGGEDGSDPLAALAIGRDGTLYGTTSVGGAAGLGTVFALTPPGTPGNAWTETVLFSFSGPDGANPYGSLAAAYHADGQVTLYGTTYWGGTGSCTDGPSIGCGTIFSLTPPTRAGGTWGETLIHLFEGGVADGANPYSGVTLSHGVLYGTATNGGQSGLGSVFALRPPHAAGGAWTMDILHSFAGFSDGIYPFGELAVGPNGALYGTTFEGGTWNGGTVYALAPVGPGGAWEESVLHAFSTGSDGATPYAGVVIGSGGVLYGTTATGGTGANDGTVFSLTPPISRGQAWTKNTLHTFSPDSNGCLVVPGLVLGSSGALYGATVECGYYGGLCPGFGCGTVYTLTPE